MENTNEFEDIDFEEQENETENQESESQASSSIDQSITIDYYKKNLQTLSKRINKIKEKLQHNRKIQLQFSMLLNKTIENQYGPIIDEPTVQKQAVPPLPPIHKESRTEIIKLIHSGTPSDVSSYFQKSNVITLLLFSDTSVFDARLKESLMRASPDIQVAFFNATFQQVKKCGEFIDHLMPLLSKFTTNSLLHTILYTSKAPFNRFYTEFYAKLLKDVSRIAGAVSVKFVYSSSDFTSLIYPTENYTHIISAASSACARLTKRKIVHITSPQKVPSFEVVSEGPLFEDFSNVMSVRFSEGHRECVGLAVALSDTPFNGADESRLSFVVGYFSPLLKLIRSILIHQTPRGLSEVARAASSLAGEGRRLRMYEKAVGEVCGAECCRLLVSKPSNLFSDVSSIGNGCEESIVGRAASGMKPIACANPRRSPDFLRAADDAPNLAKIQSMLAVPVEGGGFVFSLYNSKHANLFSPSQRETANSMSRALRHLLEHVRQIRAVESDAASGDTERAVYERSLSAVGQLAQSCSEGRLFEYLNGLLSAGGGLRRCHVFVRLRSGDVMRFPGGDLVDETDAITGGCAFYVTDTFDTNIDVAGDTSAQTVAVCRSEFCAAVISSRTHFDDDELPTIHNVSRAVLMLAPFVMLDFSLRQCKESHQLLRDATRLCSSSFSRLVSADVDLVLYDPPLESDPDIDGAPLVVSIETKNGIEGALAAADTSSEVRAASISYAQWLTAALSCRSVKCDQYVSQFVSLFEKIGVASTFNCRKSDIAGWVTRVLSLSVPMPTPQSVAFVASHASNEPWRTILSDDERFAVCLSSFVRAVEGGWECKSDTRTVRLLKKCKKEACAAVAAVFATGFGLPISVGDDACIRLCSLVSNFAVTQKMTARFGSLIVSRMRMMSMRGFKKSKGDVKWIGLSLASLWRAHVFTLPAGEAARLLVQDFGEAGAETELFVAERVTLPVLSFMSTKDASLSKVSATVRDTILEVRKILH